jgi:hypothetical protein
VGVEEFEMSKALPGKWTQLGEKNDLHWASVAVAGNSDFIAVGEQFCWRWFPTGWGNEAFLPFDYLGNHKSTLTTLPDGTLLGIGTDRNLPGHAAVGRYDLQSRVWARRKAPNVQRAYHSAVVQRGAHARLMVVGGIHIAHGITGTDSGIASCEWYVPESDEWQPAPDMNEGRYAAAVVALADGSRLMAFGGQGKRGANLSSVEMFTGEKWIPAPSIPEDMHTPSAVTLRDGRVAVTGDLPYVMVFDPEKFAWEEPVKIPEGPNSNFAGWMPIGELKDGSVFVDANHVYDPVARECRPVTPKPDGLETDEGYCSTPDGGLLMLGGITQSRAAMKFNID